MKGPRRNRWNALERERKQNYEPASQASGSTQADGETNPHCSCRRAALWPSWVRTALGPPPCIPKAAGGDGQLVSAIGHVIGRSVAPPARRPRAAPPC
eukprot:14776456-Alexandrium_andersonii.AAC.1